MISLENLRQASEIEMSKGDRVVDALQRLWQKIQSLEHAHQLEKSKSERNSPITFDMKDNIDLSLTDIQRKLLVLQLQYLRSNLCKENGISPTPIVESVKVNSEEKITSPSPLRDCGDHIAVRDNNCDKNTQTDSASEKCTNSPFSDYVINPMCRAQNRECIAEYMSLPVNEPNVPKVTGVKPQTLNLGVRQNSGRGHYHLKLSDVPFILGTSTTSHSVVANVQKIISMMKGHNKGLCSSAPNLVRSSSLDLKPHNENLRHHRTNSNPDLLHQDDSKNIFILLTNELTYLTSKLENLKKLLENSASCDHLQEDYANTLKLVEKKSRQISALHRAMRKNTAPGHFRRRHRSYSESTPRSYSPESRDNDRISKISGIEVKQVICSFGDVPNRSAGSGRREMMHQLKECQVHLQHEDIHWK